MWTGPSQRTAAELTTLRDQVGRLRGALSDLATLIVNEDYDTALEGCW